jgi:YHS domain-containing protein
MRTKLCILAFAALLAGCSGGAPASSPSPRATTAQAAPPAASGTPAVAAAPHAYPQGSIKKGDMALCAVCAVNDGATEKEAAHEVIDYQGMTYSFCNENEKAEFISNPAKYVAAK